MKRKRVFAVVIVLAIIAAFVLWRSSDPLSVEPAPSRTEPAAAGSVEQSSIREVLAIAAEAHQHLVTHLDDYTATFIKQERDNDGVLGPETEMYMKVQTGHRGGDEDSPMRVYLKFLQPENVQGREVIWAEDLHDGKLLVREAGMLGLVPIPPLDPEGMLAMRNQRYPISEIGLTKLIEKLLERGAEDIGDPNVTVTISKNHRVGDAEVHLIQVRRTEPKPGENDFSLAEIAFDPERHLILHYRAFGWPEAEGQPPPLLESYQYLDVKTNVGLTQQDFDPDNPEYDFP